MNDFHRDNEWQREQRDKILAPGFYGRYATEGRYVFIDKGRLADILQKRFAVDTVCQGKNGLAVGIEEKIVRWPGYQYACFCLETKSCTVPGHESPGWMFYSEADFLLYCFQMENGDLDSWLIDFPKLQQWFWPRETAFEEFRMHNTINKTVGRKVPIKEVHRAIPCWRNRVGRDAT
jgi:hypothetical protein